VDAARRAVVLNLVAVGGALPKGYSDDCYQRLEAALANPAFSNERKLKECEAELQFLKQVAATATPMIAHDAVIGRNGSPAQHHAEPLAADALPARTAHCGHARRTHRKKIDLLPALLQPLDPNEPLIEPPPCNKPLRNKKELKDDMTYDNPSHRFTWMVNLTKQLQARVSQNQLNLLYEIVHPGKKGGTKWLGTNWVLEDVYSAAGSAWSTWPEVYIRNLQSLRPRRRCRRVQGPVSSGTTSHDEEGEPSAGTAAKQSDDMENPRLPSRFVPAVAAGGAGAGSPGLAQARTFPASAAAAPAAAAPAVLGLPAAAGRPSVVEAQRLAAAEGGTLPPSQVPVSVGGGMPRRTRAATQPNP
jgi:hypothetical protein